MHISGLSALGIRCEPSHNGVLHSQSFLLSISESFPNIISLVPWEQGWDGLPRIPGQVPSSPVPPPPTPSLPGWKQSSGYKMPDDAPVRDSVS